MNRKDDKTLSELAGPLKGNNDVEKIVKDHLDSNPPKVSEDDEVEERPDRVVEKVIPVDVIMEMALEGLEALAHSDDIKLPVYGDMVKELTDARNDKVFDMREYIGGQRNKLSITRAYVIYKLQQI